MKNILTILFLVIGIQVMATEQEPDYLIIGRDTVPIYNNPLKQYLDKYLIKEIADFENPCWSTACWRGYKAYWELRNDSLFLLRITSCVEGCKGARDANLEKMFGSPTVFASWYTGTLTIPRGNLVSEFNMGYSAIYEKEEKIEITEGRVIKRYFISNEELINRIKLDRILYESVGKLSDTLLYYLNRSMDWEKLDNSRNRYCDDEYLLYYDQVGNLIDIKLVMYHTDSTTTSEIRYDNKMEKYCAKRMKNMLNQLSLNYIKPHKPFIIKIDLWYDEKLAVEQCRLYYETNNDKIKNWIKKQMDIKE